MRPCPVPRCPRATSLIACAEHWSLVPELLRAEIAIQMGEHMERERRKPSRHLREAIAEAWDHIRLGSRDPARSG